jgi:uncharacterized ion transporter superfamily protein YfcC
MTVTTEADAAPTNDLVLKDDPPSGTEVGASRWRFPSAFTVLFAVTVAVWLLAFIVPSGVYKTDEASGRPIPGSYARAGSGLSVVDRLHDLFMAPVNGLLGTKSTDTGVIGPYETGKLFGAAGVFLFVLAIGIFITMSMKSGAIDAGIGRISARFAGPGIALIIILMVLFSVGGTTEGMAEETLGFYALVVPLMLRLGYDRMVAASVILLGAGIGTLASTINPFATGVASGAADISIGDGIGLRLVMYLVLTAVTIGYVVRYARKVRSNPELSLVGFDTPTGFGSTELSSSLDLPATITGRQRAVLLLMGLTFAFMIFAIVPWAQVIHGPDATSYGFQLDWYFPELAALFIVMAVVIGLVAGLGEKGMTDTIVSGAGDFVSVGLIIVLARGVTVIMNNAKITDTVLHSLEGVVSGTPKWVFGPLLFLLNIPLAFLVPSSSGHAALAVPVLAPLADFAGVKRGLVVTGFQSASGWMNLFTPTSAVVMGGLALAKVKYNRYLRFIAPLLGILLVLIGVFIAIGAVMG